MKKLAFFIRNYKYDLLTALFAVILYFISFKFGTNQNIILLFSLLITLASVSIIIFLRLRDKDFYFIPLTKREHKDDWIGRGVFEYKRSHHSYLVADSDPGYIYSKCLNWNDYKYEFEFRFINLCLGVIVRAVDLSNYVMFQIREDGLRPHVRINGGWKPWEHAEAGLTFKDKLSLDKWYKCYLTCEKDLVNIRLLDQKEVIFQRSWTIPHERLGFPFPQIEQDPKPLIIHFPVDLDYGTVGFRNANVEKALVKNVLIEKI